MSTISLALMMTAFGRPDAEEISFQTFKSSLLSNFLVDKLEVVNKTTVRVYAHSSAKFKKEMNEDNEVVYEVSENTAPKNLPMTSTYKYYFHIGSVDSFERQMEEAQKALGYKADEFIPIKYVSQWNILQEIMRFAPTLLLIGGYIWLTRKSMGSFGGGATGGTRNFFNVGKAQVKLMI